MLITQMTKAEQAMPVTANSAGPYAPASAITEILSRYRNRGMQKPFSAEVLGRAGVSDSLIPRTLQALQVLDLVDGENNPTETMERLRTAPESEYKKLLEEWIKEAYADVFSFVDPKVDDETRVRDAFRSYQPMGQQTRMVTLFMGLCAEAGLVPEGKRDQKPRAARAAPVKPQPTSRKSQPQAPQTQQPSISPNGMPAALAGLLASLPSDGQSWSQERRDRFVATFGTVLDFCFPVGNDPVSSPVENHDE